MSTTASEARSILQAEYGSARNFMTPLRLSVGILRRDPEGVIAWELSRGEAFLSREERGGRGGRWLYGVSLVRRKPDGSTERLHKSSQCFHTAFDAREHIASLRRGPLAEERGEDDE